MRLTLGNIMKIETKRKLVDIFNGRKSTKNRVLLAVIPVLTWLVSLIITKSLEGDNLYHWIGLSFTILTTITLLASVIFITIIDGWGVDFEFERMYSNNINFNSIANKIIEPLNDYCNTKYGDEIEKLKAENADLRDILVMATHHDGALEEMRVRWEPIVKDELKSRWESSNK